MFVCATRTCPRCGSKFTFNFSYSTIPPQFCDNCRRELLLSLSKRKGKEKYKKICDIIGNVMKE